MSEIIIIKNQKLTAAISTLGAELVSLKSGEREFMWQADPTVWGKHAPMLFPICGGLKDDTFVFGGKEYNLQKHGYASESEFCVEEKNENSVVFLHKSNEETAKSYPFTYELRVCYTLSENELRVDYNVKNLGDGEMYFSIGAHEGYSLPGGVSNYAIKFEKEEDFMATPVEGPLLMHEAHPAAAPGNILPLEDKHFAIDAIILCDVKSRTAAVCEKASGKELLNVDFHGFDYLLIWSKPGAEYVCIEPWCGIPDYVDSDYDITKKPGIIKLDSGKTASRTHTITIAE